MIQNRIKSIFVSMSGKNFKWCLKWTVEWPNFEMCFIFIFSIEKTSKSKHRPLTTSSDYQFVYTAPEYTFSRFNTLCMTLLFVAVPSSNTGIRYSCSIFDFVIFIHSNLHSRFSRGALPD